MVRYFHDPFQPKEQLAQLETLDGDAAALISPIPQNQERISAISRP